MKSSKISIVIIGCILCTSNSYAYDQEPQQPIRKAIILAAGLGTRFLPETKAVPKEIIPIFDKPAIHYIAAEAVDAGLQELFIIIGSGKQSIVDYFNPGARSPFLKEKDLKLIDEVVTKRFAPATINYLIQPQPMGVADAISMGRHAINDGEYFAVLFPDDILVGDSPAIGQMTAIAQQEHATVIAVEEVPYEKISAYGVISIKDQLSENLFEIDRLIEKPKAEEAPSNLAIVGRYILPQKIFAMIEQTPAHNGEVLLPDVIENLIKHGEKVLAYKFPQKRFDTGTPRGWVKAIIHFGLQDPDCAEEINKMIDNSH